MIYELRTHTIHPQHRAALIKAHEELLPAWERNGIRVVGVWTTLIGRSQEFVYMLEYEGLGDREKKWEKFVSDPAHLKVREEYDEPLYQYADNVFLQPTAYSPLK